MKSFCSKLGTSNRKTSNPPIIGNKKTLYPKCNLTKTVPKILKSRLGCILIKKKWSGFCTRKSKLKKIDTSLSNNFNVKK